MKVVIKKKILNIYMCCGLNSVLKVKLYLVLIMEMILKGRFKNP